MYGWGTQASGEYRGIESPPGMASTSKPYLAQSLRVRGQKTQRTTPLCSAAMQPAAAAGAEEARVENRLKREGFKSTPSFGFRVPSCKPLATRDHLFLVELNKRERKREGTRSRPDRQPLPKCCVPGSSTPMDLAPRGHRGAPPTGPPGRTTAAAAAEGNGTPSTPPGLGSRRESLGSRRER